MVCVCAGAELVEVAATDVLVDGSGLRALAVVDTP